MAQRVTFYIDGFNFYYGLRRTKRNEPQWFQEKHKKTPKPVGFGVFS